MSGRKLSNLSVTLKMLSGYGFVSSYHLILYVKALYKQGLRGSESALTLPEWYGETPNRDLVCSVYRVAVLPVLRNCCMGFTARKHEDNRMAGKCPKCGEVCEFILRHSIMVNGKAVYPKKAKAFRIPKCDCSEKKTA